MTLRVEVADLLAGGIAITGHGEDVAMRHSAADGRIDAAQAGWQGQSGAAMLACSQKWVATTDALLGRLSDHAQGLHTSAHCFHEMDQTNAQTMATLGQAADSVTG
jgi:WXG100 family type VII secretion target